MNLTEILKTYRKQIVDEWIHRLHAEVSERYCGRPVDELFHTVSRATEANYSVLIHNDFSKINDHIRWITDFTPLKEVFPSRKFRMRTNCIEQFCSLSCRKELDENSLHDALRSMNYCLFYTITEFSNYFPVIAWRNI